MAIGDVLALDVDGSEVFAIDTSGNVDVAGTLAVTGAVTYSSTVDLNGTADALILDADGDTTISAPTDDQIDIEIAGADDFQFTANTFTALSGSSISIASGNLSVDGDIDLADGGTVTQITSITTGVTLNTHSGQITTVSSTLAGGAEAEFVVTNSKVAATDVVIVNLASTSSAGTPYAMCTRVAAGSFTILVGNKHATNALDNTLVINFGVIGGASS